MYRIFACLLILMSHALHAAPAYVTDHFKITVRSGESAQHRVISLLPSGTRVEVLSVNAQKGYTRVRLKSGKEGYILTRQLQNKPIAKHRLADLQQELSDMQGLPDTLRSKLMNLNKEYTALQSEHQALVDLKGKIETELTTVKRTAADAIRISNERNQLRKQVTDLTRTNEELKQEKLELSNRYQQRWFLIGAGVVILGILVGLILPRLHIRKRKESSWGSAL